MLAKLKRAVAGPQHGADSRHSHQDGVQPLPPVRVNTPDSEAHLASPVTTPGLPLFGSRDPGCSFSPQREFSDCSIASDGPLCADFRYSGEIVVSSKEQLPYALELLERANRAAAESGIRARFSAVLKEDARNPSGLSHVLAELPNGAQRRWAWDTFARRLPQMERIWRQPPRSGAAAAAAPAAQICPPARSRACSSRGLLATPPPEDLPIAGGPYADDADELIGEAALFLLPLRNMVDNDARPTVSIGQHFRGRLQCALCPVDSKGGIGPWEGDQKDLDPFVDDPEELLGRTVQFAVRIAAFEPAAAASSPGPCGERAGEARGGPSRHYDAMSPSTPGSPAPWVPWCSCFVRYRVWADDTGSWAPGATEPWTVTPRCTPEVPPFGGEPYYRWDFSMCHRVQRVDADWLQHVERGCILFEVWGQPAAPQAAVALPPARAAAVAQLPPARAAAGNGVARDAPATPPASGPGWFRRLTRSAGSASAGAAPAASAAAGTKPQRAALAAPQCGAPVLADGM
eukprot:TRINITY_DN20735_c0_g2_i1.p1 TRINITY_DN20735_c0_g2~~TRINITY_DN20735_c0_g2_i1.p1  ORF type:complete len:517 (+),score=86.31 TRINITY_DN20735_c0_g2_i1:121-1671(+)